MTTLRVVVTGVGVVSPLGIGKEVFGRSIMSGLSGISRANLFDTDSFKSKTAGEVKDFNPENIIGKEGLRVLDRSTKLLCCALRLGLDDAKFLITDDNSRQVGIAVGNTFGSLKSISDFDKVALIDGPKYVNPSIFPNTVINAQVSQAAIRFNIKGFNVTISTGFTAGVDAIAYAANAIRLGRKKMVIAGGVEELSAQAYAGFYKAGCLAGSKEGGVELSCPFDARRNGLVLAEGAAVLILEELTSARERGAKIYAEVKGSSNCFAPVALGLKVAMSEAVSRSDIGVNDVDCILAAANSTEYIDSAESSAIKGLFAERSKDIAVSSVKSIIGESFSASGAMQAVSAIESISAEMVPPTMNYSQSDLECNLKYVLGSAQRRSVDNVLINAASREGFNASMVLSRLAG